MKKSEFDAFAEEYQNLHQNNIRITGELPHYFAEYKIIDTKELTTYYERQEESSILDFGSGVGNSVPYLKKHFPLCNLTCLDISTKSIDIAKKRFPGYAKYCSFDGNLIPFRENSYNIVFTACVFHHIDHSEHAAILSEIYRVLKPGGLFVIFEHNPINPLTLHAVNTCPFDENAVLIKASKLVNTIKRAGFYKI